jgi:hypothetical protein
MRRQSSSSSERSGSTTADASRTAQRACGLEHRLVDRFSAIGEPAAAQAEPILDDPTALMILADNETRGRPPLTVIRAKPRDGGKSGVSVS